MHIVATSAKSVAAASFVLMSPIVLLFMGPLAIGISSDILHEIGSVPAALGFSGAIALFALYRLHYPD
ncbi:MAG TPA: hypothetical protein VHU15_14705 [Stellaceae bacterium]|nr:hypothetical protein [Stellaceae bacterium]